MTETTVEDRVDARLRVLSEGLDNHEVPGTYSVGDETDPTQAALFAVEEVLARQVLFVADAGAQAFTDDEGVDLNKFKLMIETATYVIAVAEQVRQDLLAAQ